jgi:hypothetical protein
MVWIKLIDDLGADRIMWGSDLPHPDGIWPDSREYVQKELGRHLTCSDREGRAPSSFRRSCCPTHHDTRH